jgi:hypothetical protein
MGKNDQWREEMEKMDSRKMSGFSLGSLLKEKLEIKVIGRPNGD